MNGIIGRYETYNAFDYDNPTILNGYIDSSGNFVSYVTNGVVVIPISVGKQYDISGLVRYNPTVICRYGLFNTIPTHMTSSIRYGEYQQGNTTSITAETNENYLIIIFCGDSDYNQYGSVQAAYSANCINFHVDTENWNDIPYTRLETATDAVTTLPVTTYNDGTNATVAIKGNMQQSGTPTPTSPITPSECGERTENLFDGSYTDGYIGGDTGTRYSTSSAAKTAIVKCEPNTTYTIKKITSSNRFTIATSASYPQDSEIVNVLFNSPTETTATITTPANALYLLIYVSTSSEQATPNMMLNVGSTAKPYESYGYKLPIVSGNTTTNIYLSEPLRKINTYYDQLSHTGLLLRGIKKLVLTGQENWNESACSVGYRFVLPITSAMQSDTTIGVRSMCTHQQLTATGNTYNTLGTYTITGTSDLIMTLDGDTRLASWKSWLASQYAAGTPVTVWYILATPTTETVTMPTIPTTSGGQTFDVDTTLKPSEVSLTYHGWHEHEAEKRENGSWT